MAGIVDVVVAICLIIAAVGLMIAVWLPSFSFEFLGLVSAIQRRTGVDPKISYSMIEFATELPRLAPWSPGGWFLAVGRQLQSFSVTKVDLECFCAPPRSVVPVCACLRASKCCVAWIS